MPTVQKHLFIPMRDGVRLAATVHWPDFTANAYMSGTRRPADLAVRRAPAIIEYHPYRKDDRSAARAADHDYFATHGYVSLRLDVRGTGSSEGVNTDEYMLVETQDGYDAIEWIAAQPWCDGNVAMFGSSYGGFTSLQVATLQPPHLKAIAPIYATDDRYTDDCHYKGGAFKAYYDVGTYGTMMIALNALPPDPDAFEDWDRRWSERLESNQPYMQIWLRNQLDGPYWRPGSLRGQYEKVKAATFMIGGWQDGYPNPLFRTFEHLECPKKLLIGPWNHSRPSVAIPGPRIDYLHEIRRWFDLHLKGVDDGVSREPRIAFYVQSWDRPDPARTETTGAWRAERTWPIRRAGELLLSPGDDGRLDFQARRQRPGGNGGSNRPAGAGAPGVPARRSVSIEMDPTTGTYGGLWSGGLPFGLPSDQRRDEARSIVFTSEPLTRSLTIVGNASAQLRVSSSAPVACFVAKLADVAPTGESALVARGVLNGTRRNGMNQPTPMAPNRPFKIEIPIDSTAWRFERGHRIRLAVSGSDFPNSWPTPFPTRLNVFLEGSTLQLPIVPAPRLPPPRFLPPPARVASGAGSEPDVWEVREDPLSGTTRLKVRRAGTSPIGNDATTFSSDELDLIANRRDPANVDALGVSTSRIKRPGQEIEAIARQQIRSDKENFHWSVDLEVRHNGRPRFRRQWSESFKRELL